MARRPTDAQDWRKLLEQYDAEISAAFLSAIADITDSIILRDVADAITRGDLGAAVAAMQLDPAAFHAVDDAIRRAFTAGAGTATRSIPALAEGSGPRLVFRFDVRAPSAENWLKDTSSRLITDVIETQKELTRVALTKAMEAGQNPMDTARDIVGRVNRITGRREGGIVIGLDQPRAVRLGKVLDGLQTPEGVKDLVIKGRDGEFRVRYKVNKATENRIMRAYHNGTGLSAADQDISRRQLWNMYLKDRGDTIGRTESLASLNAGRTETFRQAIEKAGVDQQFVEREWDDTGDSKVRDSHAKLNGTKVKGLEEPFVSPETGALMMFPGDPSLGAKGEDVINCRCRVNLRVDWFQGRA